MAPSSSLQVEAEVNTLLTPVNGSYSVWEARSYFEQVWETLFSAQGLVSRTWPKLKTG